MLSSLSLPVSSFLPALVRRAPVPDDPAPLITIRPGGECDPREVGVAPEAVELIWESVLRWYASGIHPAIQVCVRRRGRVILDRAIGYAAGAGPDDAPGATKVAVTPDTPFNIFSASKAVTAMLVHLLDQRFLVHLDDPVCEYIPEFAANGKQGITIKHVLTHRAGIPKLPPEAMELGFLDDSSNRDVIAMLCEATPDLRPGGPIAYHAITGGFILGEIVKRVTGKGIRSFMQVEMCKPLGWRWMNYGVRARDTGRVAKSYFTGVPLMPPLSNLMRGIIGVDLEEAVESSNDPRFLKAVLPAANLMATARELSEFYQLLLNGGELNGVRIFDPRTVWRATSEQSYGEMDYTLLVPLRYGMGFMLGGDWFSLYGPGTPYAFGHLGLTNIVSWADPARELAAVVMSSGKPLLYPELYRAFLVMNRITQSCPVEHEMPPRPPAASFTKGRAAGKGRG